MKQKLLKTMLLLCALIVGGASSVWADDVTVTWNISGVATGASYQKVNTALTTSSITPSGASGTWTAVSDGNSSYAASSTGAQLGASSSREFTGTITLSSTSIPSSATVKSVTVSAKSNGSSTLSATVGGESLGTSKSISGTTVKDYTISGSPQTGNTIVLTLSGTTASKYVNISKIVVTYEEAGGGSELEDNDLALTGAPIALNFDLYNNASAQVINYTTSSTGAVTIADNSYATFTINESAKTITVTPIAVTPSAQTITVSQAADATYAAGSATFTVAVANSAPVINASNVDIEATATSGIISYSITNPEGGASLTASETEDWISDVTVDSENSRVTFTTTTNTSYIQRTGTITLTYGDDLATKDITVNQSSATPPGSKHEWDLSTNSYSSASASAVTWTSSYATMTNSQGKGNAANNYLPTTQSSSRFYKDNILSISPSSGYKINGVVFTATTASYASTLGSSTWTNATAYVSNTKVTVIPTNGNNAVSATIGGTCGFTKVEVYYELLPIPSIAPTSTAIAATTAGTGGTISITYNYITDVMAEVLFFEADGTTPATYDWLVASINASNNVDYLIDANTGAARTAYMKVYALDDELNDVYSPLITITQAGVDYATLPFYWTGGVKNDLTALVGVTASGLGSDYAVGNAPYRVKMDSEGDYIQIKTNAQPVKVLIGVKMLGGATTSKIKVQESADGSSFTDVEELTISGDANTVLNLKTSKSFAATTRYVKIIKSVHASEGNIGVGPIMITDFDGFNVTLNSSGYATYASTYPLDFSGASEYSAWQITEVNSSTGVITFSQITGAVKAGTGVLLKGTASDDISIPLAASGSDISGTNQLVGITTATAVTADQYFGLSGNEFKKVNAGTVPAGKALLPASVVTGLSVNAFTFIFEDATGVRTVEKVSAAEAEAIFNLAGQRVQKLQRGINIVNGRKVVVK